MTPLLGRMMKPILSLFALNPSSPVHLSGQRLLEQTGNAIAGDNSQRKFTKPSLTSDVTQSSLASVQHHVAVGAPVTTP